MHRGLRNGLYDTLDNGRGDRLLADIKKRAIETTINVE